MKRVIKYLSFVSVFFLTIGLGLLYCLPKPSLLDNQSFSRAVYDQNHHLLRLTLSQDEKYRLFTPLAKISPRLIEATLLQEDQYFHRHYGINPIALFKAIWQTYGMQSRRIGASTITMQLARLRFQLNSKKITGKIEQIIRAIQLEMHYSKNDILEAYLNFAPYGGNIEGIGAASLIYFNQTADNLTLPQALTLSIIPQNPGKRTPNNVDLQNIRDHLWGRWLIEHPEDANKKVLFNLPLAMQKTSQLPFLAPHFVNMVLNQRPQSEQQIVTSLDLGLQRVVERVTKSYLAGKRSMGVNNTALVLVDTRDMGIKAIMGSGNFFNSEIGGQINGFDIKRSPGSTLKPFIYGLALDQGLIHPNTVLKDVPHSFNGYNPENFDYEFMGPIKAKDALVLSRNIPAIYLSNLLSPSLHHLLEQAHVSHLKPESYYGLSINLGGTELSMIELTSLYAALVNNGQWYPIRCVVEKNKKQPGPALFSQEASYLVLDMLQGTPNTFGTSIPVAWKTGTSSGYRDAWTIGAFGPYVLAVWIGNFDNSPNRAFVGKDIAAPLFFQLVDAIRQEKSPLPTLKKYPERMNLKRVKVCSASGMLPTRDCPITEDTWFIPGKSPIKTDTIFREVAVNKNTGLRTCHVDENTRFDVYEFWPSDLLRIFKTAGIQRHTPPFFEGDCALKISSGLRPQITSPQAGIHYILRVNSPTNNAIPLSAVSEAGISYLYWFVNDSFIAKTKTDKTFLWKAKPGKFVIRVVDDQGLSDARDLIVEMDK